MGTATPPATPPSPKRALDSSHWASLISFAALVVIAATGHDSVWLTLLSVAFLASAVLTAVHHAEVIALRIGPSLGALVLALSVTVIEVGLIVSMMTNGTPDSAVVARDTVFSAVIIVTNGIMGVCLLLGGLRYKELDFHAGGSSALLSVLCVLSGLTLVLPNYTTSTSGPTYNQVQLLVVSGAALLLYGSLVFAQTRSHRDHFEPRREDEPAADASSLDRPSVRQAWLGFGCLLLSLGAVIGFAKLLGPAIETGLAALGAPRVTVGIVIALLVLAPETWAAVSAARSNQLQTSLNLALGSGAASIALTIPVVAVFALLTER
ncbi:MAG TPA: hypothetical protein VLC09_14550, partial [Polyangiaceae bacterium]|nr:hypothetical protein [Polyangiaceae bacterium]